MNKKEILKKVKPKPDRHKPGAQQKLPHQFGSVTRYNDGNRTKPYIVRGPLDPVTGKQPYLASVRTEEEAYEILVKRRNNPYLFASNATTFKDAYDLFLMSHYNDLGKQAKGNCRSCWKHCEFLADKKFKAVTVADLQLVIQKMHDKGITYDMQRKVRQLMHYIYTAAIKYKVIDRKDDVSLDVDIDPDDGETNKKPFNRRQINRVKKLIQTAAPEIAELAMIPVMMCYAGTRPSEFCRVLKKDVHLKQRWFFIGKSKTKSSSNRIVPISRITLPYFEHWMAKPGSTLLTRDDGIPLSYAAMRDRFALVMKLSRCNHTPGECRHTCATWFDELPANRLSVKLILGHAVTDITQKHYTHKTIAQLRKTIDLLK